jgi:hypothetical protein
MGGGLQGAAIAGIGMHTGLHGNQNPHKDSGTWPSRASGSKPATGSNENGDLGDSETA